MHYAEISKRTGASTATITRIASWLNHGEGGYREMLERFKGGGRLDPLPARRRAMRERLRLAIPNKGRLLEPTLALLHDAGLVFEEHDRSLVARVQNHPLDILFVRTGDVIEFVNDGVADAGITGGDILAESGVDLPVLRQLGYGRCRLAAAVAADSPVRGHRATSAASASPPRTPTSPAASSPTRASPSRSSRSPARWRSRRASASRTRSSTSSPPGSTLAMNGLRAIGDILASEAILRHQRAAAVASGPAELDGIVTMLGSVIAARGRKYLMMNAPAAKLGELEDAAARASSRRR